MKKRKYSIRSINCADDVVTEGEVAYLTHRTISPARFGKFAKWLHSQVWFKDIARKRGFTQPLDSWRMGWMAVELLKLDWQYSGWAGALHLAGRCDEPSWMSLLPRDIRGYIRRGYTITEGDPLSIVLSVPYTGLGFISMEMNEKGYTMLSEAAQVFNLHRLRGIKQLGFLHDPVLREMDRHALSLTFEHTRYLHSEVVHALANLIGANCGLGEQERTVLNLAAFTHDALTPAGGDSTKLIDLEGFDEDAHYGKLAAGPVWENFRQKWNVDRDLLLRTVRGEGLLGDLLDIADKIGYVGFDAFYYLGKIGSLGQEKISSPNFYMIGDLVERYPHICGIWEDVRVEKGKVFFRDPERLGSFLLLRALLFRNLYYNPYARFFEYLMGKGITKYLYLLGEITKEQLLAEGDSWLEHKIGEFTGSVYFLSSMSSIDHARIEEHVDHKAACKRAEEFDGDLNTLVLVDEFVHVSNSATRRFLVRKNGRLVPFAAAEPEIIEHVDRLMEFPKITRLYFLAADDLRIPPEKRKKIKEAFRFLRNS